MEINDLTTNAAPSSALNIELSDGTKATLASLPIQSAVADALAIKAPLASPALTGSPTAPTAATTTSTTQLATTAFVQQELAAGGSTSRSLVVSVRNQSGGTMVAGTVVYINGATGNLPTIAKAIATSDTTSAQTIGLVKTSIANNGSGLVVVRGVTGSLDTSALTEGQQLYLSPSVAGTYTTTKQYAPNHLVYIGVVTRAHPTIGSIEVAVQNGFEMDELHNVSAQSPANGDTLRWNSATSLWEKSGAISNLDSGLAAETARAQAAEALKTNTGGLSTDITNSLNFAAWGDSLTAGAGGTPWPTAFQTATNYTTFNGGVGGETSTQIKTRFLSDTASRDYNVVIWAGRNNYNFPTTVKADIASMIAALGHQRYIVMGVINGNYGGYERTGGEGWTLITELNADLAALYGTRFFDIRGYLISSGLGVAGITPTAQDILDIADDIVPNSLRSDGIHLNTAGYGVVSTGVQTKLNTVIASDSKAVTPAMVKSLFDAPPRLGGVTRGQGNFASLAVGAATTFFAAPNLGIYGGLEIKDGLLYLSNNAGSIKFLTLSGAGTHIQVNADFLPESHNSRSLGIPGVAWANGTFADFVEAGGVVQVGSVRFGAAGPTQLTGSGSPEGVITAPVGSIYLRTGGGDGTAFYSKETGAGNTGWVAKSGGNVDTATALETARTINGVSFSGTANILVPGNCVMNTATLDFPSIAAGASADLTMTVTGAVVGYSVSHGLPAAPAAGIVWSSFVSAANTVTIRATNITLVAVNPASATYRATVFIP